MDIDLEQFESEKTKPWFKYYKLNEHLTSLGFGVLQSNRHNMVDGQVHFIYSYEDSEF